MTRRAEPVLLLQLRAVGTSCAGGRRDGSPSAKEEVAAARLGAAAFHSAFSRDSLQPPFSRLCVNSGILPDESALCFAAELRLSDFTAPKLLRDDPEHTSQPRNHTGAVPVEEAGSC